jgi:K+-sensing histidine kinase KdpD
VRRRDATLNIDRALRAVAYALLGLIAPALVMPVRFEVGFRSTPPALLHLIIVVLAARTGGFIRVVVVSALAIAYLHHAFVPPERRFRIRAVGLTAFLTTAPVATPLVSR